MTAPHPRPPGLDNRPLRVTVVDDDANEHLLVELAASEATVEVEVDFFVDGRELLAALADQRTTPDVVMVDLRMPTMDGRQLVAALSASPTTAAIPVMVLSSAVRPNDYRTVLEGGARWVETKPGDFEGLVSLIASLPRRLGLPTAQTTSMLVGS